MMIEQNLALFSRASGNLLNLISRDFLRDNLLIKDARDANKLEIEIKKRLSKICIERSAKGYKLSRENVIDLVVLNNKKAEEENRLEDVLSTEGDGKQHHYNNVCWY